MRERAARIGGLLEIFSTVNAGTEVHFSIPADIAFQLSRAEQVA
jgi:signal transduction histidine kinase